MLRKTLVWLLPLAFTAATSSCDSGGIGCDCMDGGMEPIPGGFLRENLVENAAQARLTPHAIAFLESNVDSLVAMFMPEGLDFPIDPTTESITLVGDVDICHPSGCTAHAEIIGIDIVPAPPSTLHAVAQVHFWIEGRMPLAIQPGVLCWCFWDTCDCEVEFDTGRSGATYNTISLDVAFNVDPITGYTAIDVGSVALDDDIEDGDIAIHNASGLCGGVCVIADWLKGILISSMIDPLIGTLNDTLAEATCRTCGDFGCPPGSTCSGSTADDLCEYTDGTCVPLLLGIENRMDVGSLLSSISPGAEGVVDLAVVAGGYAIVDDGVNLGIVGGVEAVEHNACARISAVPCDGDGDCASGFTCQEMDVSESGIFNCRRCGAGCPAGSTPTERCAPESPDDTDFNPTALCIDDVTGECVPVRYCADGSGVLQASAEPPLGPVPRSIALHVDSFEHCVYCPTGAECGAGYTCSTAGVCEDPAGACERVTEDAMVVVGISETFLRRALYGFVDSGAACLEILPGLVPQLNTALFNLAAAPSLDNVVWGAQPMAMSIQPEIGYTAAPSVELDRLSSPEIMIEDSPLLQIQLNNVKLDLYAWVEETYSRFETVTMDLTIGIGLDVRGNLIYPVLQSPVVRDVRVSNSDLLEDDTETLETLFGGVVELAMGFVPPFDPVEIPELSGIILDVPDGGLTHVSDTGEDFLALYAQLGFPPDGGGGSPHATADTAVEILEARVPVVDEEIGTAAQWSACERPEFEVAFGASGGPADGHPYEYRYRVDGSWWSDWSRDETAVVSRRAFVFQGWHDLEVQARVSGDPESVDPTPARARLLVDGLGPSVAFELTGDALDVRASDLVTPEESLGVRWRERSGGEWIDLEHPFSINVGRLRGDVVVEVEATDEAGNVTRSDYAIRGRVPGTDDTSSCGSCTVPGSGTGGHLLALLAAVGLLLAIHLGTRRRGGGR